MTVLINPAPDLSACTFYVVCDSLFDFSAQENGSNTNVSNGDKEIQFIRNYGDQLVESNQNATATVGESNLSEHRRSRVAWFEPADPQLTWLIKKLSTNIAYFNAVHWNFDITGFFESCQYTIYDSQQLGHYDWHMDISSKWDSSPRKLSVVIQLSDPSEYEGGEFCVNIDGKEVALTKEKGHMVIFPSYILHKVKPVTKGIRRSFVCWISGPKFR